MNKQQTILQLQILLDIPEALRYPHIGVITRERLDYINNLKDDSSEVEPYPAGVNNRGSILVLQTAGTRHINQAGLDLVKYFEGCQLKAYKDEVGVWTIGYGHTGLQHRDGTVYSGRVITQQEAENLLSYDMQQFEQRVQAVVKVPITEDEFSALVAFDFNTGGLMLSNGSPSTLLDHINSTLFPQAADEFMRWNKAGGSVLRGLTRRRFCERRLFLSLSPVMLAEDEMDKQIAALVAF